MSYTVFDLLKTRVSDINGKITTIYVDELVDYLDHFIYAKFASETRPRRMLVSELQATESLFEIYASNERGTTIKIDKARCFPEWPDRMIRSYLVRNPEQHSWFKTVEVDTIEERDRLQYDPDFAPESYVWVRNGQYGPEPEEYILTANRQFWVDIETYSAEKPSGKRAIEELYNRLSSGYLFDTFGPSGQNKEVCDFVFVTFINSNLTARTWTKTGDQIRWDFGNGSPVTAMGVPAHTYVEGNEIVTFSTTDTFENVSYYQFYNSFRGAFPRVDFSNVINGSLSFLGTFCGPLPDSYDVSNISNAGNMFRNSKATSLPDMNFDSLTTSSSDIFDRNPITDKIGKLSFTANYITPPATIDDRINLSGMFRYSSITGFVDIQLNGDFLMSSIAYGECYNFRPENIKKILPKEITDEEITSFGLKQYNAILGATNITDLSVVNSYGLENPAFAINLFSGIGTQYPLHIPPLKETENDGPFRYLNLLGSYSTAQNISLQSLKNIVKSVYDRRFAHKQAFTGNKITLNLQPYNIPLEELGPYRNSATPRFINQFIYKLVENPDNEDINEYEVFYNNDPVTDFEKNYQFLVEIDMDITEPKEVSFLAPSFNILDSRRCYVEWGDGNTSSYRGNLSDYYSTKARTLKNFYEAPGNYILKIYMNNIDSVSSVHLISGARTNNPEDIKHIRAQSNIPMFQPIRMFQNSYPNLESFSFNEGKNNKAMVGPYFRETFEGCTSLRTISPLYVLQDEAFEQTLEMFNNTGNIESVVLENMYLGFSIANNKLNAEALNALFTGLADVTSNPQTVTVTGNPGILEAGYDPTIATSKGWTVVD